MGYKTHDLGSGWEITVFEAHEQRERPFATVRNPDSGERVELNSDSFETLRKILNKAYRVT